MEGSRFTTMASVPKGAYQGDMRVRRVDADELLGPCPADTNQEQAEFEAMQRFQRGYSGHKPTYYDSSRPRLPSEIPSSELDRKCHAKFVEAVEDIE